MGERSHRNERFVQFKGEQNRNTPPARLKFVVQLAAQGFEPIAALTAKEPSPFHLAWVESERPTKYYGVSVCSFSASPSGWMPTPRVATPTIQVEI